VNSTRPLVAGPQMRENIRDVSAAARYGYRIGASRGLAPLPMQPVPRHSGQNGANQIFGDHDCGGNPRAHPGQLNCFPTHHAFRPGSGRFWQIAAIPHVALAERDSRSNDRECATAILHLHFAKLCAGDRWALAHGSPLDFRLCNVFSACVRTSQSITRRACTPWSDVRSP
jgi:hypothetical protein